VPSFFNFAPAAFTAVLALVFAVSTSAFTLFVTALASSFLAGTACFTSFTFSVTFFACANDTVASVDIERKRTKIFSYKLV
jgi:hypothetical protein